MTAGVRVRQISAACTGRYLVRAADGRAPLLVGIHGYGESADDLLAQIEELPGIGEWSAVCVQALHPFYSNRTGKVVASWMTRLDREAAIRDNVAYVGAAVSAAIAEVEATGPVTWLGFSQGSAMAYRAAALSGHRCGGVVVLGGDLPPELEPGRLAGLGRVMIGRGAADTWYTEEKLVADVKRLQAAGLYPEVCRFAGGHEFTDEFRAAAGRFLATTREIG